MSHSAAPYPLHVEVLEGPRSPIVFLPGLGATSRYWKERVGRLRERGTLILVDLLEAVRHMTKHRPGWELRVLPGVGHHPLLQAPAATLEFIARSLDVVRGEAAS